MYIAIIFENISEEIKEILLAILQETAEGFEENGNGLTAIFLKENYNEEEIAEIAAAYKVPYKKETIASQNWNALWESNFDPVIIDHFAGIRASFHEPLKNVQHEIIITPKMSFGTGHHATTYLMMQQMGKTDFTHKSVFDFGTGTGVLAILAHKLGASEVVANDIDEWSITNARENFAHNNALSIQLLHSGSGEIGKNFDIILANINRNVLLENMPVLSQQLKKEGHLIMSGILEADIAAITKCCSENGLRLTEQSEKNKWVCLTARKLVVDNP
ncbi:MAG: 50S ribosomal protein L11 methyltransferase [Niabella sp.]